MAPFWPRDKPGYSLRMTRTNCSLDSSLLPLFATTLANTARSLGVVKC